MAFPTEFVWGVSAAAYQIEGAVDEDGRAPSVWDAFCERPGAIVGGQSGRVACDHYHRYGEDIDLMAELGVGAYRLSVAWPRILPEGTGAVNEAGLDFYERLIDGLLDRGIQPWVTLFHWDLPLALHHRGGWLNRDSAEWFAEYAAVLGRRLGDRVRHWMTLNEPQVFLAAGYQDGHHAPGARLSAPDLVRAAHHCLLAHGRAVAALREHAPATPQAGWALTDTYAYPASDNPADVEAARRAFWRVTENEWIYDMAWFVQAALDGAYPEDGLRELGHHLPAGWERDLEAIAAPLDFLGVNAYQGRPTRAGVDGAPVTVERPPGYPQTMFHWPVDPAALEWGVRFLHERYGRPIYVTENGCAAMDWVHADGEVHDAPRVDFLTRYLVGVRRAIEAGADVRGYFHWSIMDNFEWARAYQMRFGLVHVHFETLKRTPKDSFRWYQRVIATNGDSLPDGLARLY